MLLLLLLLNKDEEYKHDTEMTTASKSWPRTWRQYVEDGGEAIGSGV